jgi:hypothetical protein
MMPTTGKLTTKIGFQKMNQELITWIEEAMQVQQSRIDDATSRGINEVKLRAEGYLEALYRVREMMNQTKSNEGEEE